MATFSLKIDFYDTDKDTDKISETHDILHAYSDRSHNNSRHVIGCLFNQSRKTNDGNSKRVDYISQSREGIYELLKNDIYDFIPQIDLREFSEYNFKLKTGMSGCQVTDGEKNYVFKGELKESYVNVIEKSRPDSNDER